MDKIEAVTKIINLFKKEEKKVEKHEFATAKLVDGVTVIEYDGDLQTGTIVMVVDESGKLPLPSGQYELEDGTTFDVVDEMGTADNVVIKEAAPENPDEVAAAAPDSEVKQAEAPAKRVIERKERESIFSAEQVTEIEAIFNKALEVVKGDNEKALNDLNEKFEALTTENTELKEKFAVADKNNKEVLDIVSQIADEPISEPTEKKKDVFNAKQHRADFKADLKKLNRQ